MVLGWMKGEPLITKLAALAKYVVFPGAMVASVYYSPPDYVLPKNPNDSQKTKRSTLLE